MVGAPSDKYYTAAAHPFLMSTTALCLISCRGFGRFSISVSWAGMFFQIRRMMTKRRVSTRAVSRFGNNVALMRINDNEMSIPGLEVEIDALAVAAWLAIWEKSRYRSDDQG